MPMLDARQTAAEQKALWLKEQKRIAGMFHRVFDTDDGKQLLDWFSKECMEHDQTFVPESDRLTSFNEGKRSLIRRIRDILNAKIE